MERSADDGDKPPAAVLKGTITAARSREASQSAGDCSSCMHCAQGRCTTSRSAGVTRGGGGNNEGRNLRSAPFVGAADDKRDSAPGERTPPPVHIDGRPADNQQAAACHSANLLRGTRSSAVTYGPSGSRPARKLSCAPARAGALLQGANESVIAQLPLMGFGRPRLRAVFPACSAQTNLLNLVP